MNFIKNLIAALRKSSISSILGRIDSIVHQLEAVVKVEEEAIASLRDQLVAKNAEVDRAYKAIHNISQLTAA